MRYYNRISSDSSNSLVKLSCLDNEVCRYEKGWIYVINKLQTLFTESRTNMSQVYQEHWENLMYSFSTDPDSKLRSYARFKKCFKMENYVLQFPQYIRRNLTKLRISAHSLAIETGRYTRPQKLPIDRRTCFHCDRVEDEFHFIFDCKLYSTERNNFAKAFETAIPL